MQENPTWGIDILVSINLINRACQGFHTVNRGVLRAKLRIALICTGKPFPHLGNQDIRLLACVLLVHGENGSLVVDGKLVRVKHNPIGCRYLLKIIRAVGEGAALGVAAGIRC